MKPHVILIMLMACLRQLVCSRVTRSFDMTNS